MITWVSGRLDRDERGSASVYVIGLIVMLMVVAGLVVDGGRAVNARAALADDAEQAARAGANQLDLVALRGTGEVRIDRPGAEAAARDFLLVVGYAPDEIEVDADAERVQVSVEKDVPTQLLSLILVRSFHVTGDATARAVIGIDEEIVGGAP
ncbi:Tad domain-containing protein [uncultured Cellulomonas sp.]|uniref:TadE/TadG family type IV pilus assembly protein n=1 Tax=uncultured Cellulomonas sp. TaxID=189682 RepID=UPI0028ED02AD|nr:Tad domain-containing protein [uncultured Cellulomonas sp.]